MASSPACGMTAPGKGGQREQPGLPLGQVQTKVSGRLKPGPAQTGASPDLRAPGARDPRAPAAPGGAINSLTSGSAWPPAPSPVLGAALTTLGGSLYPGRYLTFSCSVLMMSVSRRPPTSSSSTHMVTRSSKALSRAALLPAILAMTEPLRGQSGAAGTGEPRAAPVTGCR